MSLNETKLVSVDISLNQINFTLMKKLIIGLMLQVLIPTVTLAQQQCIGTTKAGKQCSRKAKEGSAYCYQHNPSSFHCGATTKAGKPCMRIVKKQGDHCAQHKG